MFLVPDRRRENMPGGKSANKRVLKTYGGVMDSITDGVSEGDALRKKRGALEYTV